MALNAALEGKEDGLEHLLRAVAGKMELWPVEEPKFEELERFREELLRRPSTERDTYALCGLALAVEANRLRIDEDFRGAEERFRLAAKFAASGSVAPWLVARILDLRASLWIDMGAFNRARRDLNHAAALGGGFTVDWNLAVVAQLQEQHIIAIQHYQEGLKRCPDELLPKLRTNLAFSYACLGQAVQAKQLVAGVTFSDSEVDTARATWVRGMIAKEIDWPSYLPLLEAAHAMFGLLEDLQGTALTAIDIALEYAEQGDFGKLRETAAAAYSILLGLGAEPQAIAAFSLMAKAQAATLDAIPMRQAIIRALSCRAVPS